MSLRGVNGLEKSPLLSFIITRMSKASIQKPTWNSIVMEALTNLGGVAHLGDLYREVEKVCHKRRRKVTTFYQDKVRQVVQRLPGVRPVKRMGPGYWRIDKRVQSGEDEAAT